MYLVLILIIIAMSLMIHELAHALAMHSRKIPIDEIGFGFKIPRLPNLILRWPKRFPQTTFTINHLPIIAYVKPSKAGEALMANLSYTDRILIYGAGILGNIFFAFTLMLVSSIFYPYSLAVKVLVISIFCGLSFILWKCKGVVTRYLLPLIGIFFLGLLFKSIIAAPTESVGGPITIIAIAKESKDFISILEFGALINISLAILNALPIYPLDGGRIFLALAEKRGKFADKYAKFYKIFGLVVISVLLAAAFSSDILRLLGY